MAEISEERVRQHDDIEGWEQPQRPASVERPDTYFPAARLLLQEQCGDQEAAQDEEGIERHGCSWNHQEGRYRENHVHVGDEDDENRHSPKPVPSGYIAEAARLQRWCQGTWISRVA